MKLYYTPGACSLAAHIALCEAGLPYQLVRVDLKTKQTEDGQDFTKINPKGYIPVLETDAGELITEVSAIVQYIADLDADLNPQSQLAPPAHTMARVRLQEWLGFIASEIHKNFYPLFFPVADNWREVALANLEKRLTWVNSQLQDKTYLMGEQFTVADAYLYTVLNWCRRVKVDLSGKPELVAYIERVAERPAVQKALAMEGFPFKK